MNLTDIQAVKTIIVHDNCADGLASAILLHDVLPNAKVRFIQYGTPDYVQLKPEPNMLFCDFSPPAQVADDFAKAGTIILDHHKGAQKMMGLFGDNGVFGDEVTEPGVCGAVLAYRHVWVPLAPVVSSDYHEFVTRFSTLAGIRDTWQNKSPLWRDGCVHAETLNLMTSERWMAMSLPEIADKWASQFLWVGEMLWERHEKKIAKTIKGGHRFTTPKGSKVIVFEGVRNTSDAAEVLDSEVDLIIGFNMFEEDTPATMNKCPFHEDAKPSLKIEKGTYFCFGCQAKGLLADHPEIKQATYRTQKIIFSSRSHTTYDCLALAKAHGGGGHTKAAGFNREMTMDDAQPYQFVQNLINAYEAQ
jgi:hypothetical protein